MSKPSAGSLLAQIKAYQAPQSKGESLEISEPYLFEAIRPNAGEIHGNDDFLIEDLGDDDLDIPLHIA